MILQSLKKLKLLITQCDAEIFTRSECPPLPNITELTVTVTDSSHLIILYTDKKESDDAIEIYQQSYAHEFSFVDCLSFAVMELHGITEAFTFDKHFEQAGFEILKSG